MEILNKYKRWKPLLIPSRDKELDFVLSQDNANTVNLDGNLTTKCLVSFIDTRLNECIGEEGRLMSGSGYTYERATNEDVVLHDIGLTGIDNGLIKYDKSITLKQFIGVLTGTTLEMLSGDTRLVLSPVDGNSKYYNYPAELVTKTSGEQYYAFKGGFLQGFFKLDGFEYQVLPNDIDRTWNLEFVIRPRTDYGTSGNTLNDIHPENAGTFFFIGTRSENKFARFYGADINVYPDRPNYSGDCFDSCTKEQEEGDGLDDKERLQMLKSFLFGQESDVSSCDCPCGCNNGSDSSDDKKEKESGTTVPCVTNIETSNGHVVDSNKYTYIKTDNKYLIFDRAKGGYTTETWNDNIDFTIEVSDKTRGINLYPIMNRTCSGYTTETLDKFLNSYTGKTGNEYNIIKDIKDNAFALKVNEDGSIGYKYFITDCDSESGYTVLTENTKPALIRDNSWNVINVMFKILDSDTDKCGNSMGNRKMKLFLYVNGYLKLVSKELPEFRFRALNDESDKQEAVPFNISLGGGTQGMAESMWTDNYTRPFCKVLPLEENFGGSFIGDIRSFKFYDCQMQYNEIKNNYMYEMGGHKPSDDKIKDNLLYYGFGINYNAIPFEGQRMLATRNIRNKYVSVSAYDDAHFYVVISKKYIGAKPTIFTCGGAPMVMYEREEIIAGKQCIVYESGALYAPETELTILSDNL